MVRKGPTDSATNFIVGTIKKGNDGNRWIVIEIKNGVHRWRKVAKNKSSRWAKVEADPNSAWGKNIPLEKFWRKLATGTSIVLIYKNGKHKMITKRSCKTVRANLNAMKKIIEKSQDDPDVKAILASAQSSDGYEALYEIAKKKSPASVIKNYTTYFTKYPDKIWYAGK